MKKSLGLFTLLIILGLSWNGAAAEPQPPKVVVNHDTQECGEIFGGDECMDCLPALRGWEALGYAFEAACPEGYTTVEVDYVCQAFKDEFCCTEGHSGADGDCEDMVINESAKQCAFVDDIEDCNLPQGWSAKPDDVSPYDWTCSYGTYAWVEDLECLSEPIEGESDRSNYTLLLIVAFIGLLSGSVWLFARRRGTAI